jgi:hypothetical protein
MPSPWSGRLNRQAAPGHSVDGHSSADCSDFDLGQGELGVGLTPRNGVPESGTNTGALSLDKGKTSFVGLCFQNEFGPPSDEELLLGVPYLGLLGTSPPSCHCTVRETESQMSQAPAELFPEYKRKT